MEKTVTAIVCCFNEERSVEGVVLDLLRIPFLSQIIVVDDGSTDQSGEILKKYTGQITIITNELNRGKGYSVSRGLEVATGELILLLDADILNYTAKDLSLLVNPVLENKADYSIKISDTKLFWHIKVSGIRCYHRSDLIPLVPALARSSKYGLEFLLNKQFKPMRGLYVKLHDYTHLEKFRKYSLPKALWEYTKEAGSLIKQLLFTRDRGSIQ